MFNHEVLPTFTRRVIEWLWACTLCCKIIFIYLFFNLSGYLSKIIMKKQKPLASLISIQHALSKKRSMMYLQCKNTVIIMAQGTRKIISDKSMPLSAHPVLFYALACTHSSGYCKAWGGTSKLNTYLLCSCLNLPLFCFSMLSYVCLTNSLSVKRLAFCWLARLMGWKIKAGIAPFSFCLSLLSENSTFVTLQSYEWSLLFSTISPQQPLLSPPVSPPQKSTLLLVHLISAENKQNKDR